MRGPKYLYAGGMCMGLTQVTCIGGSLAVIFKDTFTSVSIPRSKFVTVPSLLWDLGQI